MPDGVDRPDKFTHPVLILAAAVLLLICRRPIAIPTRGARRRSPPPWLLAWGWTTLYRRPNHNGRTTAKFSVRSKEA